MPVLVLELASSLGSDGEPGVCAQTGAPYTVQRTLAGQKPLPLSSLSTFSTSLFPVQPMSSCTETTLALLRDGTLAVTFGPGRDKHRLSCLSKGSGSTLDKSRYDWDVFLEAVPARRGSWGLTSRD